MTTEPADRAIERVQLELATRKLMVMTVGAIGVWVGIAIMLTGAPSFLEGWFSPWSRYSIGGTAFLTGCLVSIGGMIGDRRLGGWWTQVAGLTGLALWYLAMSAVYVVLVFDEGVKYVSPGESLDPMVSGRGYVPIVYLGLLLLAAIPLATMLHLGRPVSSSSDEGP